MGKKARQKIIKEYDKQIVIDAYLKAICQRRYTIIELNS